MQKIIIFIWIIFICILAVNLESPIDVESVSSQGFSALNAKPHIEQMAQTNHYMGTSENRKIKNYILNEFSKLDIPTEVFIGNADHNFNNRYVKLARTENIIATIKGSNRKGLDSKAVLISGHYDSVLSAPGAADDVHAVACMLEVAKMLRDLDFRNDIIFLVTDGEEMGLFGAKSFVEEKDLSKIGMVLNYEARGNSGASISFEWSEGNAWLVNQLRKVGRRPVASSLSYEIYNLLPNNTDFTFFKKAGLPGINHAFIDGFSYYHNPDDTPRTLNLKSVQHTGENMYLLAKHFANSDLSKAVSHDASFFNFLSALVIYPSELDLFILCLAVFLIVFLIYNFLKAKKIKIKSLVLAFLYLICVFVFLTLGMKALSEFLFKVYPQYEVFYAGQFYNHKIYILTIISFSSFILWHFVNFYSKRNNFDDLKIASLLLLVTLAVVFNILLPTATYFISIPTVALSLIVLTLEKSKEGNSLKKVMVSFLLITIPLGIWVPVVNTLFLAFSLSNMMGPVILSGFICLSIFITFEQSWKNSRIIPLVCILFFIGSFIWAHLNSYPTDEKPLPSSLIYNYNLDDQKGNWITNDDKINIGNEEFLNNSGIAQIEMPYKVKRLYSVADIKPHVFTDEIKVDSLSKFDYKLKYNQEAFRTRIYIENVVNIKSITINDQTFFEGQKENHDCKIDVFGLTQDSLTIKLDKLNINEDVTFRISSQFLGFPVEDSIPTNARRQDGFTSIVRSVKF